MTRQNSAAHASWWRESRILLATVIAVAVGAFAFAYRFNTLGGALGGFDNDHFAHLMRTEMLMHGEQPLRDFADAELRGAWPSLSYAVPAWAQQIGGRTLLSEAYLTVGALALASVIVYLLALDLSRRWSIALLASVVAILMAPKLYNYPKVLVTALGALVIRTAASAPSPVRLGVAALVTAVATLFRHDYGVYVAAGMIAALVARDAPTPLTAARNVGIYAALTAVLLLPSAMWVQVYEGIPTYVRNALATSALETRRTELRLPPWGPGSLSSVDTLLVVTYYVFWAVPVVAVLALLGRVFAQQVTSDRATAAGLLAMAVMVNVFFLRANLQQRFGDAVVPVVLLAAWTTGAASMWKPAMLRVLLTGIPVALLLIMLAAAYVLVDVRRELDTSGLSDSWEKTTRRFRTAREDLSRLPPATWSSRDDIGTLRAARYVAECTSADDYLLVAGHVQEVPVFARRRFAAGQATFSLSFYQSEAEQRRALARLERQSVPIILADAREYEEAFTSDYPLLARHVAEHYREAGTIVAGSMHFLVFVETDRPPRRVDPHLGLPCFQ